MDDCHNSLILSKFKTTNLYDMINVHTPPQMTHPKAFKHRFPRLGTDHEPPVTAVPSPRRSLNASPRSPGSARSASPMGASPRTLTPRPSQAGGMVRWWGAGSCQLTIGPLEPFQMACKWRLILIPFLVVIYDMPENPTNIF